MNLETRAKFLIFLTASSVVLLGGFLTFAQISHPIKITYPSTIASL
jgi:hypothetical protein